MRTVCLILLTALGSGLRSQASLHTENAALRHQLAVLQRQARGRPRLRPGDRLFWAWLCRLWPGWRHALVIVKPATVLRWHRYGFRLYWRWKSRPPGIPPGHPVVIQTDPGGRPGQGRDRHTVPQFAVNSVVGSAITISARTCERVLA